MGTSGVTKYGTSDVQRQAWHWTSREYRRNRELVLAASQQCWICGHEGADTADHLISLRDWPEGVPGFNDISNLAPAHGHAGCQYCPLENGKTRKCNFSRGAGKFNADRNQSRRW